MARNWIFSSVYGVVAVWPHDTCQQWLNKTSGGKKRTFLSQQSQYLAAIADPVLLSKTQDSLQQTTQNTIEPIVF